VTIAIAAITNPDDVIVCASDRMISYGDAYPADDNAIVKAIQLSDQWTAAWSSNNIAYILPIVEEVRRWLDAKIEWKGAEAATEFAAVYSELLHKEFVAEHLSRFN